MMDNDTGNEIKTARVIGIREGYKGMYHIQEFTGNQGWLTIERHSSYTDADERFDALVKGGFRGRLIHLQVIHDNLGDGDENK